MKPEEIIRLQTYLRKKLGNQKLTVVRRATKDDSAEVKLGDEFIGVLFRDDEDGEVTYNFDMAILEIDLEEV